LLKNACCLQFGATICNASHGLSIKIARLNNAIRLQQLNIDVLNLERRLTMIDYGDVLQQETLKGAPALQGIGSNCRGRTKTNLNRLRLLSNGA
jgi:hypothetical protein